MKCNDCGSKGTRWIHDRTVQGQDYGPSEEGHTERCKRCNGSGEIPPYDMSEQEVLEVLGKAGAVIVDSHIVYTSGKHGTAYVNKDAIYPHTKETSHLCRAIAERFAKDRVEAVITPAVGGVIISQWTAYHLSMMTGREVLGVYAEKEVNSFRHPDSIGVLDVPIKMAYTESGRFIIKRGYDKLVAGKRVLVGEDLLTTGSAKKVVTAVRAIGCDIVGLGVLCNRGGVTPEYIGVPRLEALVNVKLDAWEEEDCPFCKQGVPSTPTSVTGERSSHRKK